MLREMSLYHKAETGEIIEGWSLALDDCGPCARRAQCLQPSGPLKASPYTSRCTGAGVIAAREQSDPTPASGAGLAVLDPKIISRYVSLGVV